MSCLHGKPRLGRHPERGLLDAGPGLSKDLQAELARRKADRSRTPAATTLGPRAQPDDKGR